jgi:hypothetical protein
MSGVCYAALHTSTDEVEGIIGTRVDRDMVDGPKRRPRRA